MNIGVSFARPLLAGRLVRRYERFIAEVRLDDGRLVRAHCVNPGRMEGLVITGGRVWLSEAATERKLPFTWELMEAEGQLVGVNTIVPNRLVRAVLEAGVLRDVPSFDSLKAEQKFGRGHRVDLKAETATGPWLVEVKNCHLRYSDGRGYFPDSVSERAASHVAALARVVNRGERASVFFTVQRSDVEALRPSALHDPTFARAIRRAAAQGVTVRALRFQPTLEGLWFDREIPVDLSAYDVEPLRADCEGYEPTSGWVRANGAWAGRSL